MRVVTKKDFKIPIKLINKFLCKEGFVAETETMTIGLGQTHQQTFPYTTYHVKLDLSDEPELLKFCYNWIKNTTNDDFRRPQSKVDVGCYLGIFPYEVSNNIVKFSIDIYDPKRKDWKDWFICKEGE